MGKIDKKAEKGEEMKKLLYAVLFSLLLLGCQADNIEEEIVTEDHGDEVIVEEEDIALEDDVEHEEEEKKIEVDAIDKYQVFSNYELDHIGYLSEARTFFHSEEFDYVLGYGHQAHAVNTYELFEVNKEEQSVTIIRFMPEDSPHYEEIESMRELERWEEEMITYMLENVEEQEEVFFKFDKAVEEEEVNIGDNTYALYPVKIGERTHYFKEAEGLWMKLYEDDLTIDLYGEKQKAVRIVE